VKFGQWIGVMATAAALLLLWQLRDVVIHLFAAVVLAMALCTLVGVVQQRLRCGRGQALQEEAWQEVPQEGPELPQEGLQACGAASA